jgi:glycosyltransferase involved in cell wall biosynthesis
MRIGIDFSHNLPKDGEDCFHSGIATYTKELVVAMAAMDAGNEFHIFTGVNKACKLEKVFGGFRNIRIREALPEKKILGKRMRPIVKKVISKIWKELSTSVDVLHFTEPVCFNREITNAVSTIHDIIRINRSLLLEKQRQKRKIGHIAKNSKRIIVPSLYVKEELSRLFPSSACTIDVIHEGAKKVFARQSSSREVLSVYGIPSGHSFFLNVGRLEKRKNLHNQLAAYKLLPETIRRQTGFVVIGNGSCREVDELVNFIEEAGIEKHVRLLHGVPDEDLAHFYNAARALLFVSNSEGFGLPLLEAMNCGCPSIISNVTSLPEVAGQAALMASPQDTDQIAGCMRKLATDDALHKELAGKSLERARMFSWQKAAAETLACYEKALS